MTQSFTSTGFGRVFQNNRAPIVLIGVGIGWLFASNTGLAERIAQDRRVQAARRRIGEIAGEIGIGVESKLENSGGLGTSGEPALRTGDMGRRDGWVHQAAGAARGAISSVRDAGSAVLDRAGSITEYAGDAGDLAKRAGGQLAETIERDPWLIGVIGLVGGALLAAVLPPTQVEQEFIAEARSELRNTATVLGHEAAERVRELAEATARGSRH